MKTKSIISATLIILGLAACKKEKDLMLPVPDRKDHFSSKIMSGTRLPVAIYDNGKAVRSFLYQDGLLTGILEKDGSKKTIAYDELKRVSNIEISSRDHKHEAFLFYYADEAKVEAGIKKHLNPDEISLKKAAEDLFVEQPASGAIANSVIVYHYQSNEELNRMDLVSIICMNFDNSGRKVLESEIKKGMIWTPIANHFRYDNEGRLVEWSKTIGPKNHGFMLVAAFADGVSETASVEQLKMIPGEIIQTGNPTLIRLVEEGIGSNILKLYKMSGTQPAEIWEKNDEGIVFSHKSIEYLPTASTPVALNVNVDEK